MGYFLGLCVMWTVVSSVGATLYAADRQLEATALVLGALMTMAMAGRTARGR